MITILYVNSFWSKMYAFSIKDCYSLLYIVELCGWQKFPSTILKSSGVLVYSANQSTFNTKDKFIYLWNTGSKQLMGSVPIKQDTMVHNLEHYRSNCVLIEDQRVLKIKKLKSKLSECEDGPKRQYFLEEIRSFEFKELKEKKAIYMNDTGSKIFYRIQNMGVVFWDYFTGESRRVRIEIPDYSFYSAVCAFEHPSSKIMRLFGDDLDQAHHFMIISALDNDKKDSRIRHFMLFDIDEQRVIATFGQKDKPKLNKKSHHSHVNFIYHKYIIKYRL